jgi:hypothetical protein
VDNAKIFKPVIPDFKWYSTESHRQGESRELQALMESPPNPPAPPGK